MIIEIRERGPGRGADKVWTYYARTVEIAARQHIDEIYGRRSRIPPDYWTLHSLKPEGQPSRVDGRQNFEAKFRTERAGGIADWETLNFVARPLSPPDEPDVIDG